MMKSPIRRVISDGDDVGNEAVAVAGNHETGADVNMLMSCPDAVAPHNLQSWAMVQPSEETAVIENDNDDALVTGAPVAVIPTPGSSTFTTNSSLSDTSDMAKEERKLDDAMEIDEVPSAEQSNESRVEDVARAVVRSDSDVSSDDSGNDSDSNSMRASSQNSSNWGWFEDVHGSDHNLSSSDHKRKDSNDNKQLKKKGKKGGLLPRISNRSEALTDILHTQIHNTPNTDAAAMAVTAPTYVLEESFSSQKLWKFTAGQRPPQPMEERAFFEKMWAQNFARSQVNYKMPVEVLTATSPICLSPFADGNFDATGRGAELSNYNIAGPVDQSGMDPSKTDVAEAALVSRMNNPLSNDLHGDALVQHQVNRKVKGTDGDMIVKVRGDNVFGTTVSKSFTRHTANGVPSGVDTVNISVASYRVVETKRDGKFAQFLVIYREGSIQDTVGVWKRYSDFVELSKKVTHAHEGCASVIANMSPLAVTEEHEIEHLPNAITSWRLLKKRQRWYRCLDAGYLSLKVFLLERFLHDILFESSSPKLLRDFVDAGSLLN